jgi:transcriptional regulator with XRE-family HTH domain
MLAMETVGQFLRTMRARKRPEANSSDGRARRTPGLRREEVAERAGVSVDWYVRLEQDRAQRPSSTVLDGVARALGLSAPERRHLYRLAHAELPSAASAGAALHPSLMAALGAMPAHPALILGLRLDVLATNALGEALFDGFGKQGKLARNAAWFTLCDPRARDLFPDYTKVARETVGVIRSGFSRRPFDTSFLELIGELSAGSPLFASLWAEQHVAEKGFGRKRFRHPEVGLLNLAVHTLCVPEADAEMLVFYTALDDEAGDGLELLVRPLQDKKAATPRRHLRSERART